MQCVHVHGTWTCASTFYKTFTVRIKLKTWKNNIFTEAAPNCLVKCFHQPQPDALVKIEITLASTVNVARPLGRLLINIIGKDT